MTDWKPIETAPKGGKRFLAYVPIKNHRLVIANITVDGLILNENAMPMSYLPTYWMPLPNPPTTEPTFKPDLPLPSNPNSTEATTVQD